MTVKCEAGRRIQEQAWAAVDVLGLRLLRCIALVAFHF